jgi:DNA helicase-2/ATP-dependent DNA helicase PcrA
MDLQSLASLNPEQLEAVRWTDGPTIIVAGPGSGKTRVLTQKIAYLIKTKKAKPEEILAVTFTNKAAEEMRERVSKLLNNQITKQPNNQLWIGTFHATCAKILRRDGRAIGIPPSFVIYDIDDQRRVLKKLIRELAGGYHLPQDRINPAGVGGAIEAAKRELIGAEEYGLSANSPFFEAVAEIYPRYQRALRQANALDFSDLITETIRLFKENEAILKRWQNRFHYILVDEYQDTNRAQYVLTKMLSAEYRNICAVGDMSQAIYSWRGADYRNILHFERDFAPVKVFRLPRNYRSTKTILGAAKNLIENNRGHIPLDLKTGNEKGEPIAVYEAEDEHDEAAYIAQTVGEQLTAGGKQHRDFAVLYRTNAQSRVIEETFIRAGIPYLLIGGTKFYERREIKDVLAYLRLVLNRNDIISRERAEKIGKKRLAAVDRLIDREKTAQRSAMEILDGILEETNYLDYLDNGTEEGTTRVDNVKELRSVATAFPSLTDFLEHVSLVDLNDAVKASGSSRDAVTLMTLHAAKGLEFPAIFIAGVEEGLLPHNRSMYSQEELEEERRLTYVGITRAKKTVHLTFARERLLFGSRGQGIPSRFLGEIGDEHLCYHSPWD